MKNNHIKYIAITGLILTMFSANIAYGATINTPSESNSLNTSIANFNPLTASNSELIQNGYPVRPATTYSGAYQEWLQAVKSIKNIHKNDLGKPTHFRNHTLSNIKNGTDFTGWTGYSDIDSYSYNLAQTTFTVPLISGSSGEIVGTWVGLGGTTSTSTLFQAGIVQETTTGVPVESAFFEYVNGDSTTDTIPMHDLGNVRAGDTIYSEVYYMGNNEFYYDVVDETTNTSWSSPVSPGWSSSNLTSAEYIVEAPEDENNSNVYYTIPDFGSIQLNNCYADNNGTSDAGGLWPNIQYDMSQTSPSGNPWPYDTAGSWNSSGTSFTVTYHSL